MKILVISNPETIRELERSEYLADEDYDFIPVGGYINKEYDRAIIDFMDLSPINLKWINDKILPKIRKPVLPTMPDFLKEEVDLNDKLLKLCISKTRDNKE